MQGGLSRRNCRGEGLVKCVDGKVIVNSEPAVAMGMEVVDRVSVGLLCTFYVSGTVIVVLVKMIECPAPTEFTGMVVRTDTVGPIGRVRDGGSGAPGRKRVWGSCQPGLLVRRGILSAGVVDLALGAWGTGWYRAGCG